MEDYGKLIRMRSLYAPAYCTIELTHCCNFQCHHCYIDQKYRTNQEMTTKEIMNLLNQIKDLGVKSLALSGGEPLLREDIFEIIAYAKELGFFVTLFSNGSLIDEYKAKRLKSVGLDAVNISLYGTSERIYEAVTAKRAFTNTISALRYLKDENIIVNCGTVALRYNAECLADLFEFCKKNGFIARETTLFEFAIYRIIAREERQIDSRMTDVQFEEFFKIDSRYSNFFKHTCNALRGKLVIKPNGDIIPCTPWPESYGNCKETNIGALWKSSKAQHFRKKEYVFEICENCGFKKYCDICIASIEIETPNSKIPPKETCRIAKIKAKVYG